MFQYNLSGFLSVVSYQDIAYLVIGLLLLLPFLLVLLDTFFRILFLIVSWIPHTRNTVSLINQTPRLRILYLFVANNEQKVIGESIRRVQQVAGLAPIDSIAVIADHCIDQTVEIAIQAGVIVYQRTDGNPGKSEALSWFASEIVKQIEADIIVVLDADTLVGEKFSEKIKSAFEKEVDVVQVFVHPIPSSNSSLSLLAAYSELLSQKIDDKARSQLGWSVPLRGTGMVFRKKIFDEICRGIDTQVDDIELSLLLIEKRSRVRYYSGAEILDPKANNILGLARQRGRWLKGQRQIWRERLGGIWKLVLTGGLSSFSLIQALLIKPKTIVLVIKFLLGFIFCIWPFQYSFIRDYLLAGLVISFLADIIYFICGLQFVSQPHKYLLALLISPSFIILWAVGLLFSICPGKGWLKVWKG